MFLNFLRKNRYETVPGIPIQTAIAQRETISKLENESPAARYDKATGNEITPRIRCATFQVSSSCTVHGNRKPVWRLNGSFEDTAPAKTMTQEIRIPASSFSLCSEKDKILRLVKMVTTKAMPKIARLKNVTILIVINPGFVAETLERRARFRTKTTIAAKMHRLTIRMERGLF